MKHTINLLAKKDKTVFDRTVYFFLNYLRYILVITQLIVLMVLFYRFRVDENISELKSSIRQKNEIVNVVSPLLDKAYVVGAQMNSAGDLVQQQQQQSSMMSYIFGRFPASLFATKVDVEPTSIYIDGTTNNYQEIQQYHRLLSTEQQFEKIELSRIVRVGKGYEFTLSLIGYTATN